MLYPLRFLADYYFACSDKAGEFCYGKKVIKQKNYRIIHNGVDCDKFEFKPMVREEIRKKLGLKDECVILNVGRLEEQKNHRYLLDIAAEMKKQGKKFKILIAGEGVLRSELENIIKRNSLENEVLLLGLREDIDQLMQAADIFILTSLFEGLPVAGVEAQASGLPCIFSDTITKEIDITGRVQFVSLKDKVQSWIDAIFIALKYKRENTSDLIKRKGYDIKTEAKWLSDFYKN